MEGATATSGGGGGASNNAAPTHPRGEGNRGRGRGRGGPRGRGRGDASRGGAGRGRGRGGGASAGAGNLAEPGNEATGPPPQSKPPTFKNKAQEQEGDGNDDEVCFICASDIDHRSITPCNHDTCHICALRMRALYKDKNCPHCRVSRPP